MVKVAFEIDSYGATDIGLVREKNEDAFKIIPEKKLFILADGMGGHKSGEIASSMAVETLSTLLSQRVDFKKAFEKTNEAIYLRSQEVTEYHGMGTTLVALQLHEDKAHYAHVGDSRLYLYRDKELLQLTQDHSLANEMLLLGLKENASSQHVLTQAIGTSPKVEVKVGHLSLQQGDLFLLTSDGLTHFVPHENIVKIIAKSESLEVAAQELIFLAKKRGGSDNITLILVRVR